MNDIFFRTFSSHLFSSIFFTVYLFVGLETFVLFFNKTIKAFYFMLDKENIYT